METIIDPIPVELLKQELNEKTFLRKTNKAGNEIYVVNYANSPNVVREVGRLREITFRSVGSGSGTACDIDHFDIEDKACYQLVLWNPDAEEIIGGYRFTRLKEASFREDGQPYINSAKLFRFTSEFCETYFPHALEMARAWVQPKYQSREMGLKSLFALDNIWDGIGGLIAQDPSIKYLMGKVSMFATSPRPSLEAMIYFLEKFCGDKENLIVGINPEVVSDERKAELDELFCADSLVENYKILNTYVTGLNDKIPPLIHLYLNLSSSMKTFGTVMDPNFGEEFDTEMIIAVDDIYMEKYQRYIQSAIDQMEAEKQA